MTTHQEVSQPRVTTPLSDDLVTDAVVWGLVEASPDGVALVDADGRFLLVNRQIELMFGYERAELLGNTVEMLIPTDVRELHKLHREGYVQSPRTRPMGIGLQLSGLRKDGSTFPLEISLSPLETTSGRYTIASIRDVTETRKLEEAARVAAVLADQERVAFELHDKVIGVLFQVGLSLESALNMPSATVRQRILGAVAQLDETIREIRSTVFARSAEH